MRILHTSDWHLGHELASHRREVEHEVFLAWLLDQLDAQDADVLLVTGDVYDVANPPVSAMRRLFDFLRAATTRRPNLQVVVIGGNHDSAARIDLPSALLGAGRVRFVGAMPRADGAPDCAAVLTPLLDGDGAVGAWLAAVPFCRPGDLGAHTLASLYDEVLDKGAARAGDLPLVVTGHLHIAGGAASELSERRIVIGGQEAEASSLFDRRAAYVALGHLHRPQWIPAQVPIRYAGSPFPLSSTERNYRHSISLVSLAPGKCDVAEIPIPRPVPFLALPEGGAATLDQVIRAIEQLEIDASLPRDSHPFLEIAVLVDGPEPHLQSRVLAALEGKSVRLTRIEKVMAHEAETEARPLAGEDLAELQPGAVFEAMFRSEYGDAPPEDLARAFDALLVEVETAGGDD